jgi:Glycosyltransferase
LKILHLIYTRNISGAEKYLLDLLPGLKKHGIECEFICVGPKKHKKVLENYCAEMSGNGVKSILLLKTNNLQYFFIAQKINRHLVSNNIKIIHSHLFIGDMLSVMVKTFYNKSIRIFSTKHGYQEEYLIKYGQGFRKVPHNLYYYLSKIIIKRIDENIATSQFIADMYKNLKLVKNNIKYIHHGIKIKPLVKTIEIENPYQLIVVGRLEKVKGHKFLIDSMPLIIKKIPSLKLLILGEGTIKKELEEQAYNLGISSHIQFLGFQKPERYIPACGVIVIPSLFEAFGMIFIEAFALKTPVVAFNVGAGNEIIENNQTGILVPPFDVNALAEIIIYLLENPNERQRIAENAYQKFLSSFTADKMIDETALWYRLII